MAPWSRRGPASPAAGPWRSSQLGLPAPSVRQALQPLGAQIGVEEVRNVSFRPLAPGHLSLQRLIRLTRGRPRSHGVQYRLRGRRRRPPDDWEPRQGRGRAGRQGGVEGAQVRHAGGGTRPRASRQAARGSFGTLQATRRASPACARHRTSTGPFTANPSAPRRPQPSSPPPVGPAGPGQAGDEPERPGHLHHVLTGQRGAATRPTPAPWRTTPPWTDGRQASPAESAAVVATTAERRSRISTSASSTASARGALPAGRRGWRQDSRPGYSRHRAGRPARSGATRASPSGVGTAYNRTPMTG